MQKRLFLLLFLITCLGSACVHRPLPPQETAQNEPALHQIQLGVGYIPNVQFAPFYVAQAKGFYEEVGLDVSLEYGFENDFVALTANGEREFAIASGDQVILAGAQSLPLVYIMKWYERYPVAVMTKASTGIAEPAQLDGHSVGIPGLFGASFVAWKALVYAGGIDEASVDLASIGFTQAEAVSQGTVDAAVVYIANEPVQLTQAGEEVTVFEVSNYINLVSNGLVTNQTMLQENPDMVQNLVQASLRGLAYTIENPEEAFKIAREFIPDMSDDDAPTQQAVLNASISLWLSETPGFSDPDAWSTSAAFMLETGLIDQQVEVDTLYTNDFIE